MYDLDISIERRDEVQPRVILIESQMKDSKHYFLHWSWPDPAVVCEVSKAYHISLAGQTAFFLFTLGRKKSSMACETNTI